MISARQNGRPHCKIKRTAELLAAYSGVPHRGVRMRQEVV